MTFKAVLQTLLLLFGIVIGGALALYVCGSFSVLPYSFVVVGTRIPKIRRAYNYLPVYMTVSDISLSHTFCCRQACFCDEVDDARVQPCAAMVQQLEALPANQCRASPGNSTVCPPAGAAPAAVCNNGAFCCSSCNKSICSSSSRTSSSSSASTSCPCPCSHCRSDCGCCKRVESRLCRLFCDPCDKVRMVLHFQDQHGQPHSVNIARNYSLNSGEAQRFYDSHQSNDSSVLAFFKPSDPSIVHFTRGYGGSFWAYFILIGALPVALAAMAVAGLLLLGLLGGWYWAGMGSWALWVGIVVPLCILLPILQVGYPTPHVRTVLIVLIPLLSCLGLLPLLPAWRLRHRFR